MSKFPKLPRGSLNPFERGLEAGMRVRGLKAVEVKKQEDTAGGCGNKNCPMCYPEGKPEYTDAGRDVKPMSSSELEEEYRRMKEQADREMKANIDRFVFGPGPFQPPTQPPVNAALAAARKACEEWITKVDPSTSWSDVIGNDAAREALIEAIEAPLKEAALYKHYGMKPPKGVLLWGPPGNGKTMFARAAGAAVCRHFSSNEAEILVVNGATLQSPWVGETEDRIVTMFAYAKEYKKAYGHPLIIFIDEADAILPPRNDSPVFSVRNVSTFLAEMDGIEESSALVILATNRPEQIDEALLRDGRCDRKIKIERPTLSAAKQIVFNELGKVPVYGDPEVLVNSALDFFVLPEHRIADFYRVHPDGSGEQHYLTLSHLISGAMMVGLVMRAKSIAFRRDRLAGTVTGVSEVDLREAVSEIARENVGLRHEFAARDMIEDLDRREQKKTRYNNSLN